MTKLTYVSNSIQSSYCPYKQNVENILKSFIQYYLLMISWNNIFNHIYKLAHGKGETLENTQCIPCTTWQQRFVYRFNPLSPNGDQHQFSPNNIHTLLRD